MTVEEARDIVEAFESENPEAYRLARIISLAVRIEPEYVRTARLSLLSDVHAGAESDLWFSPLVQSQTPMALEFFPEIVELLREKLTADQELLQQAWNVLKGFHSNAPYALQLEEELTWLALSSGNNQELIEKRLHSVVVALRDGARTGLARWAKRALPTLPEKARTTDAARRLSLVVGMQTASGPVLSEALHKGISREWFSQFSAVALDSVPVGVRLLKKVIRQTEGSETVNGAEQDALPIIIEFSYPPAPESKQIEVPNTYRLLLEVSWQEDTEKQVRRVNLLPRETQRVEVDYGEVTIRTALGDVYTVGPHFDYDFLLLYNRADEELTKNLIDRLERQEWGAKWLKVNSFVFDQIFLNPAGLRHWGEIICLGRKVGFIVSTASSKDSHILQMLIPSRPEPTGKRDWLINILATDDIAPAYESNQFIDFRRKSRFEESYSALWTFITGEPLPAPIKSSETGFRKSIAAGWKRLFRKDQSPPLPPQQIVIKVETPQPLPATKELDSPQPPPLATHLPRRPAVGFVARRDKGGRDIVTRLKETLTPESSQLIVLWGEGGIGKTTLAAEAARELFAVFAKRILWTSADGREDFSLSTLLDEIATQLGQTDLRRLAIEPKKEDVRALIAAAPTLIVLDQFEVISPVEQVSCAKWISDAQCSALITTRQQIKGAHNILIDAMSLEEAREFLNRLIAQAGNSRTFEGLDRGRIIQSADANPLVMQWIIAQIGLAIRPDDVLDDLAHGEGDAAKRVFDRSFKLPQLSDDGRAALLSLSLFVPSASRPALAEVAGLDSDVKRLNEAIKSLAALCLVETTDAGERLTIKGLTRELARAHLYKDERASEFRRRFVDYFLRYAKANAKKTAEDFDALEKEKDNILNAMELAFEIEDWESVIRMMDVIGDPVSGFLSLRGYWDEFIRRGEQVLMAARTLQDGAAIARFTHNIAVMYQNRGDLSEARRLYNESLDINKKLGSQSSIASSLHNLAAIAQDEGDTAEARRLYSESLDIEKKLGNQSGIASSLHELGRLAQAQGEIAEARRLYNESLDIKKKLGNQSGIASSLHELGRLAQAQGEIAEARRLYNESLDIKKKLGNQFGIAISLQQLGTLARDQEELDYAQQLFDEALAIHNKLGNQAGIANTLYQMGLLTEQKGDITEAKRLLSEALNIYEKIGSPSAQRVRALLDNLESTNA